MPAQPIPPDQIPAGKEVATLAGGCFWCLEAVYDDPTACSPSSRATWAAAPRADVRGSVRGDSGHAEVVRVTFDPRRCRSARCWRCSS